MLTVVHEDSKPGYHLVFARCELVHENGTMTSIVLRTTEPIAEGLSVPPKGHAACVVQNRRTVAHLTVRKRLIPSTDGGSFDLSVGGRVVLDNVRDGDSIRLLRPTDTYRVSEDVSTAAADEGLTLLIRAPPAPLSGRGWRSAIRPRTRRCCLGPATLRRRGPNGGPIALSGVREA